jgi:predicted GTPase
VKDLETTINKVPCDVVIVATPIDLNRLLEIKKPSVRVTYELQEVGAPDLTSILDRFLARRRIRRSGKRARTGGAARRRPAARA